VGCHVLFEAESFFATTSSSRYCSGKTVLEPLMALLSVLYEDIFPWHPNWRAGDTHPAVIARSAVVDTMYIRSRQAGTLVTRTTS
jgi:hypothetical protein